MVKSQNGLKGTKPVGVLEEISKIYQNLQGRALAGDPFIVKFQPVIAYKILLGQLYQKRNAYTDRLTSTSCKFWKKLLTWLLTPL